MFISSYYARTEFTKETDYVNGHYYSGNSAYVQKGASIGVRRLSSIGYDLTPASSYSGGCSDGIVNNEITSCEFGDKNSENSILLVGGSRLAHWEPVFSYIGNKNNFKVVTATMNGCSFGYNADVEENAVCQNWNNKIIAFISNIQPRPKVVIMNSSRTGESGEYIPPGYVKNIKEVLSLDIPVVGIRINPIFNEVNTCVLKNDDASECAINYLSSLKKENPIISIKEVEGLEGFYPVDFTGVLCSDGMCPAVFNGYPAMRDDSHLTESYVSYLAKSLEKSLDSQVDGFSRFFK